MAAPDHEAWYQVGRIILYLEMLLAVLVTAFALSTALHGTALPLH